MTTTTTTHDVVPELRQALVSIPHVCTELGIERSKTERGKWTCPRHGGGSLSVRLGKDRTIQVRCFGCDFAGDVFTLIAEARGLRDFREVLKVAADIAASPVVREALERPVREERQPADVSDATYAAIWEDVLARCSPIRDVSPRVFAYLRWRRIEAEAEAVGVCGLPRNARDLVRVLLSTYDREQLELAGALRPGHDALDWPAWTVCIPWRDRYGRLRCVQRRRLDDGTPKYRSPRGRSPVAPFGVELLGATLGAGDPDAEVILVEGALDCLARRSIARGKGERAAVMAVYSASAPCRGLPVDLLRGRRVVLALDDDPEGDRACTELAAALQGVAGALVRERPPIGAKDWGGALMRARSR